MEKVSIELVRYDKIKHLKFFVNRISLAPNHIHNEIELGLVLSGTGNVIVKQTKHEVKKGDIFLINSNEVHSIRNNFSSLPDEHPVILIIQISNHFLREYIPSVRTTVFDTCKINDSLPKEKCDTLTKLMLEACATYFGQGPTFRLETIIPMTKILGFMYREIPYEIITESQKKRKKERDLQIERIISYIDANFESQIRLADIAEMEGITVTYLSHIFTSNFGVTFQEYVNIKRFEECLRLMGNSKKTLLEISYESGFSDPKYMNKMFLKRVGMTPKECRAKIATLSTMGNEPKIGATERIYNTNMALDFIKKFAKEFYPEEKI